MRRKPVLFEPRRDSYRWFTHRPLNCLIFILPLLGLFHFGSAWSEDQLLASIDLSRILGLFGSAAWYLPPAFVIIVLLLMHVNSRNKWRFQPWTLAGMVVESFLWTLPLFALNYLCSRLLAGTGMLTAVSADSASDTLRRILPAVGAGVYEEFIFRLVMISGLCWLLNEIFNMKKDFALLLAIMLSALAFSLYHYAPASQEVFEGGTFVWRVAAGICLGIVYSFRGYGVAAGAHTLWSIYFILAHPEFNAGAA